MSGVTRLTRRGFARRASPRPPSRRLSYPERACLTRAGEVALALGARERGVVQDVPRHRRDLRARSRLIGLPAQPVDLRRARLCQHRELDQVAGQARVALGEQARGPLQDRREPAREGDPLAGLLGTRGGQQVVRLAVVPAPVEPPDIANENVQLRDLIASDHAYPGAFTYSILQILPRTAAKAEVLRWERHCKEKLGSMATGLNSN